MIYFTFLQKPNKSRVTGTILGGPRLAEMLRKTEPQRLVLADKPSLKNQKVRQCTEKRSS